MMQNKLDIYIVTYNRAQYLKECIGSILNQSYRDFDLYVLDNASTDSTREVVESVQDSRMHYICHPQNLGGRGNINYAYEHCRKDFFIVFHDDDLMHDNMLEKELAYMENHPECALISCQADILDMGQSQIRRLSSLSGKINIYRGEDMLEAYLYHQKHLIFPSILYNNRFMKDWKLRLNDGAGPCSDVVLYLEVERMGGEIAVLQEALMDSRLHPQQDSSAHFGDMLIRLFHFLNSVDYYHDYLRRNIKGQHLYFRWFMKKVVIRSASGAISVARGKAEIEELSKELQYRRRDRFLTAILLQAEALLPEVFRWLYRQAKERNS